MSATAQIEAAFQADAAARHAGGLPLKQAELAACIQLVRDARQGKFDLSAVREFIIEIEVEHGRPREVAEAHATAVLAGQQSDWARRDFGYPKGRARRIPPKRIQNEAPASEPLSQWADQNLGHGHARH